MRRNTAPRWSGRTVFGAVIVAVVLGLSATPASAHTDPVSYSPAEGAVVTEQPGLFTITTNDELLDLGGAGASTAIQVSGPSGATPTLYYGDGCVTIDGATAETEAQLGQPGDYTVSWQVVSTDGHPVSGEYIFTWEPADGQQLATGSATVPNCGRAATTGQPATDAAGSEPGAPTGAALADVAWIVGALGAVLLAAVGTLLIVIRRKQPFPPGTSEGEDRVAE